MTEKFVFYSSLAFNILKNKFNLVKWYDRIDQHVLIGAIPLKGNFPQNLVLKENVRAVISMNEDFELNAVSLSKEEWESIGIQFLQLPTKDYVEVPSLTNLHKGVQMINKIIHESINSSPFPSEIKPSVYVHCKAGRTRSATLVACYLVNNYGMSPIEAQKFIQDKRPHILLTEKHMERIQRFQDSLGRN